MSKYMNIYWHSVLKKTRQDKNQPVKSEAVTRLAPTQGQNPTNPRIGQLMVQPLIAVEIFQKKPQVNLPHPRTDPTRPDLTNPTQKNEKPVQKHEKAFQKKVEKTQPFNRAKF
jgi:hypothetical protein